MQFRKRTFSGLATIFILGAVLALSLALIETQSASAQEDNGQLDIVYLTQGEASPPGQPITENLYMEMKLLPPAGHSFVFEVAESTTPFEKEGDKVVSVYYRLVESRDDCQAGVRPERATELSSPNVHKINDFVHAHDSAFANAGFLDEESGSLLVSSHRLDVRHVLGRYVCAVAEVRSDASPESSTMYAHIVGNQRITLGSIVRPVIDASELASARVPFSPFLLRDLRLTVDRSRVGLGIDIYHYENLPENSDYEDHAGEYWRYKLMADVEECPSANSSSQASDFNSFLGLTAGGQPQSNTSPVKHLSGNLVENPADVKGKYLCLETKLKDQPAEYSYYLSAAIDWTEGQIPTEPSSNWSHLTRDEKLAFNPYRCADEGQIDEDSGWCLDGSGLAAIKEDGNQDDGSPGGTSDTGTESSGDSSTWIVGGLILAAIVITITCLIFFFYSFLLAFKKK